MKLRVPHTFVLLFALVVLAAIATHLLPAGEYQRTEVAGRKIVDPDSYRPIPAHPAGFGDVFLAWPRGLAATASIVFYIFIIGGAFGVLQATGALD
ncbi:MAG: YfcC family protein, partial [Amaricoccus sp.]|nr:YfcC family protein [Amaricoccus sp.]